MRTKKEQELFEQRQMQIANSLYELGVDEDIIKTITTVELNSVLAFRENSKKKMKSVDETIKKDL